MPKKKNDELKVWNHKVKTEKTRVVTIKDLELNVIAYKTTENVEGIRVKLEDNGILMDAFADYCESLQDKLSEREKKYNLIQFSTFGENDKGLDFFQMIGYYKLGTFVVFHSEPDSPKPYERLAKWIDYYKAKFGIETKPKKDLYDVLEGLELTDDDDDL